MTPDRKATSDRSVGHRRLPSSARTTASLRRSDHVVPSGVPRACRARDGPQAKQVRVRERVKRGRDVLAAPEVRWNDLVELSTHGRHQ